MLKCVHAFFAAIRFHPSILSELWLKTEKKNYSTKKVRSKHVKVHAWIAAAEKLGKASGNKTTCCCDGGKIRSSGWKIHHSAQQA
jgi:hypothetical protein